MLLFSVHKISESLSSILKKINRHGFISVETLPIRYFWFNKSLAFSLHTFRVHCILCGISFYIHKLILNMCGREMLWECMITVRHMAKCGHRQTPLGRMPILTQHQSLTSLMIQLCSRIQQKSQKRTNFQLTDVKINKYD